MLGVAMLLVREKRKEIFGLAFLRLLDDLITRQKNGMSNRKIGDLEMGYSRRILP